MLATHQVHNPATNFVIGHWLLAYKPTFYISLSLLKQLIMLSYAAFTATSLAMKQHKTTLFALKNTFLSTGRAIVLTTIILIGGFSGLLFSGFKGTYYIGLLVSGTLIFALLVDLFVLPYLLYIIGKKK